MTESAVFSRLRFALLAVAGAVCVFQPAMAQETVLPVISAPQDGDYVRGSLAVQGTTDIPGFASTELAFAYASDPTGTWFPIQGTSAPVTDGLIATWDTSSITDGDYVLRLRVTLQDGSGRDATVNVKVRNYSAIPTASPAVTPTQTAAVLIPTALIIVPSDTPTAKPPPIIATPTALPPNPAGITSAELLSGFWRGALAVVVLILLFGALIRFRR